MSKKLLTLVFLCLGAIATANAVENPGYVYTSYGEVVRDGYGQCLHTVFFDSKNGLAECGEAPTKNSNSNS